MIRDYDAQKETRVLRDAVRCFPLEWFRQDEWHLLRQAWVDLAFMGLGMFAVLRWPTFWVCLPAWVLIASRMHALNALTHDLGHFLVLKRYPMRRLVLDLFLSYPILLNVDYFHHAHNVHHWNSNFPERDPYYLPLHRWTPTGLAVCILLFTCFLPFHLVLRLLAYPITLVSTRARRLHVRLFSVFGPQPYFGWGSAFEDRWKGFLRYIAPGMVVAISAFTYLAYHRYVSPFGPALIGVILGPVLLTVLLVTARPATQQIPVAPHIWKFALGPAVFWYGVAILLTWKGWWLEFLWAYWVPFLVMHPIFFIRLMMDHVPGEARDNSIVEQLNTTTNMEPPWWQELIICPHAAACHGFHHVAPGVPNWFWQAGHHALKASGSRVYLGTVFRGYGQVIGNVFRDQADWRRGKPREALQEGLTPRIDTPSSIDLQPTIPRGPRLSPRTVPSLEDVSLAFQEAGHARPPGLGQTMPLLPETLVPLSHTALWRELDPEERHVLKRACARIWARSRAELSRRELAPLFLKLHQAGDALVAAGLSEAARQAAELEEGMARALQSMLGAGPSEDAEGQAARAFVTDAIGHPWWTWVAMVSHEETCSMPRDRPLFAYLSQVSEGLLVFDRYLTWHLWGGLRGWRWYREVRAAREVLASLQSLRGLAEETAREIVAMNPAMEPLARRIGPILAGLEQSRDYHEALFSRRALPGTFSWIDRFPDLAWLRRPWFPLYRPHPVAP